ncbi:unnamed protein product [Symbiodinium microadriaticum]|nr:unnamed protein product [Symbiodinium microadriaticum]
MYRLGLLAALVAFIAWAASQPTEFDGLLEAQKDFVDDLYSGKLLTDYSQSAKDTIDRNKRVPDLDDLLRQVELDELTDSAANRDEEQADRSSLSEDDDSNHDGSAEDGEETDGRTSEDMEDSLLDELLQEREADDE